MPYILVQAILYVAITYPMIGYEWSAYKVFWHLYASFSTFLYFVYLGMLIVSVSPNSLVASILATAAYTILNLFAGFLLPRPVSPSYTLLSFSCTREMKGSFVHVFDNAENTIFVLSENCYCYLNLVISMFFIFFSE